MGLGDIGQHFPDSDPRWQGADSRRFVRHCADTAASRTAGVSSTPTSRCSRRHRDSARIARRCAQNIADGPRRRWRARSTSRPRPARDSAPSDAAKGSPARRRAAGPRERPGGCPRRRLNGVPRAGTGAGRGRIREIPEDFGVDEVLGFEPDGRGGHLLLPRREARRQHRLGGGALARDRGVSLRDVGYSGHKDRRCGNAPVLQAARVRREPPNGLAACQGEGFRVLSAAPHGRKLGPARTARTASARDPRAAGRPRRNRARLLAIAAAGVPNYFGPQRFGRDGSNLHAGTSPGPPAARRRPDRNARGFALSAARSDLFNRCWRSASRAATGTSSCPAKRSMLDGRRSFFHAPEIDASLQLRCLEMDVHPSGPLPGRGAVTVSLLAAEIEAGGARPARVARRITGASTPGAPTAQPAFAGARVRLAVRGRRLPRAAVLVAAWRVRDRRAA